ncbi:MAG: putative SAM-depedent methyltransferase [Myxococcaceae bacterium]|nr:putative SAM-depedent methyltransferase [Myxococcaceae bacterium]
MDDLGRPSEPAAARFVFMLCQPGAEPALKRELSLLQPGWAPAYQRPGLVTFRSDQPVGPELTLLSVFARQYGLSLASVPADDVEAIVTEARKLPGPLCLHVIERVQDEPDRSEASEPVRALDHALRARLQAQLGPDQRARTGQLVLSVIIGDDRAWLLGLHRHGPLHSPYPGGRPPLSLPADAPSRAYLKIEEAIASYELPIKAGDTALEIGAAPGGAAYALVRRGVHVLAVDPAAMDPAVLAFQGPRAARVTHLPHAVGELAREQLPRHVEWLLLDVHLAPQVALRAARRLASVYRSSLLGAVLTLKLNDWRFADRVPAFLAQAREMGLVEPRAKQLVSHRQELAIIGLTARGHTRV